MKVYVKDKNKSLWHWEMECPQYPEGGRTERVYKKPISGEFCTLCKQIEAEGKHKITSRDIYEEDSFV